MKVFILLRNGKYWSARFTLFGRVRIRAVDRLIESCSWAPDPVLVEIKLITSRKI